MTRPLAALGLAITLALGAVTLVSGQSSVAISGSGGSSNPFSALFQETSSRIGFYNPTENGQQTNCWAWYVHRNTSTPDTNYLRYEACALDDNKFRISPARAGTGTNLNYLELFSGTGGVALGTSGSALWLVHNNGTFQPASGSNRSIGARSNGSRVDLLFAQGVTMVDGGTRPTCDSTQRGRWWMEEGGAGVADVISVCTKNADDGYTWKTVSVS